MSGIIRVRSENRWTTLPNATLADQRLSVDTLGLLVRLLSHGNDWHIRMGPLQNECRVGRDRLRRMLRELEVAGYLRRERHQDERGHWVWESVLWDTPIDGLAVDGSSADGSAADGQGGDITNTNSTNNDPRKKNPSRDDDLSSTDPQCSTAHAIHARAGEDESLDGDVVAGIAAVLVGGGTIDRPIAYVTKCLRRRVTKQLATRYINAARQKNSAETEARAETRRRNEARERRQEEASLAAMRNELGLCSDMSGSADTL